MPGNSTLLVLAAPECWPRFREAEHTAITARLVQEPELIGLVGSLSSALRRAEESKPRGGVRGDAGGRVGVSSLEHSGKAVPVYLCHLDPAVTRLPHSGLSFTGLAMNLLPPSSLPLHHELMSEAPGATGLGGGPAGQASGDS